MRRRRGSRAVGGSRTGGDREHVGIVKRSDVMESGHGSRNLTPRGKVVAPMHEHIPYVQLSEPHHHRWRIVWFQARSELPSLAGRCGSIEHRMEVDHLIQLILPCVKLLNVDSAGGQRILHQDTGWLMDTNHGQVSIRSGVAELLPAYLRLKAMPLPQERGSSKLTVEAWTFLHLGLARK